VIVVLWCIIASGAAILIYRLGTAIPVICAGCGCDETHPCEGRLRMGRAESRVFKLSRNDEVLGRPTSVPWPHHLLAVT